MENTFWNFRKRVQLREEYTIFRNALPGTSVTLDFLFPEFRFNNSLFENSTISGLSESLSRKCLYVPFATVTEFTEFLVE